MVDIVNDRADRDPGRDVNTLREVVSEDIGAVWYLLNIFGDPRVSTEKRLEGEHFALRRRVQRR